MHQMAKKVIGSGFLNSKKSRLQTYHWMIAWSFVVWKLICPSFIIHIANYTPGLWYIPVILWNYYLIITYLEKCYLYARIQPW